MPSVRDADERSLGVAGLNATLRAIRPRAERPLSQSKLSKRVVNVRNGIVAFVALLVVIVVGYGLFRSSAVDVTGDFVEGTHYKVIEGAAPVPAAGPIRVTEFFSYGCIHCRNFDPIVNDWLHEVPSDVEFDRSPVAFSDQWSLLAQAYFALRDTKALDENHERLFKAIHDNGKQFPTAESIAEFVDGHGVTGDAFLKTFNSDAVVKEVSDAAKRERSLRVSSVPTVDVADHYTINMDTVPRKRVFDVVEFLVAKIRADRAGHAGG
jgi:thiol:disulfide interchange protein DsbA